MSQAGERWPHFVRWDNGETWLDILPAGETEPPLITRDELLLVLRRAGDDIPPRTLRFWEYTDGKTPATLPKAVVRHHQGKKQALYPEWVPMVITRFRYFHGRNRTLAESRERVRNWLEALFNQPPDQRGLGAGVEWVMPSWIDQVDTGAIDDLVPSLARIGMKHEILLGARMTKARIVFEDEYGMETETIAFGIRHPSLDTTAGS